MRRSAKQRDSGVVVFPEPGFRLWTGFCVGAAGDSRERMKSRRNSKGSTRRILCPIQLPAVLRALDALNTLNGAIQRRLEMTQVATPYELPFGYRILHRGFLLRALYPVYMRASFIRDERWGDAALSFRNSGYPNDLSDPMGPIARCNWPERVGSWDRAKAEAAYQDLLLLEGCRSRHSGVRKPG